MKIVNQQKYFRKSVLVLTLLLSLVFLMDTAYAGNRQGGKKKKPKKQHSQNYNQHRHGNSGFYFGFGFSPPPMPTHRCEQGPARHRRGFVWIEGHYDWRYDHYVWVEGHWKSKRHGQHWINGHWKWRNHSWVWIQGRWT